MSPGIAERVVRRAYDLAVRARLMKYRMAWRLNPEDWNERYADGRLDFYGAFGQQAHYSVLRGFIESFPRPARILDVGCGVGILRARLAEERVGSYLGIDPSKVAIDAAQRQGFHRSAFRVDERPADDDGLFDVIVLNEMIYYVEDIDGLLRRLDRSLAEDGLVVASIYRHEGDIALRRYMAAHFDQVSAVRVLTEGPPKRNHWVACFTKRGATMSVAELRAKPVEDNLRLGPAGH